MITLIVENIDDTILIRDWDSFVLTHSEGTIFQSPHYFQLFTNQKEFRPVAVLLKDDAQNVIGVISGVIQYQLTGVLKNLTSRCIVVGGPLVQRNDPDLLLIILEAFDKHISNKAIYTQFRNLFDINFGISAFTALQYNYTDHLNIRVDLTRPEAVIRKDVHKQKHYQIGRASREDLTVKLITSSADLKISYELLSKIYKRIKLPIFPFHVFQNAFNLLMPIGEAVFFGAYLHDELVGTMYTLCYKGLIYDYFAGSNSIHYKKFPNSLIPWEVMMWGKNNGMILFDWGGAGKPGIPYGVRDYKEQFGGQYVNFGRFEKINKPILFRIVNVFFKIWQRIK